MPQIQKRLHPEEETLERYLSNGLSENAYHAVEDHLLVCEDCRRLLDEVEDFVVAMRQATANLNAGAQATATASSPAGWRTLPVVRLFVELAAAGWRQPMLAKAFILLSLIGAGGILTSTRPGHVQTLRLETMRGEPGQVKAVAGVPLDLQLDAQGLVISPGSNLLVQMVDASGGEVMSEPAVVREGSVRLQYGRGLSPGVYWVRLRDGSNLLREFSLPVSKD